MNKQTIEKKYNLEKSYDLNYIDYRNCLEDNKEIEQLIQSGELETLYELNDHWIMEQEWESIDYILKELIKTYGEIPEKDHEEIIEYLRDHNDSDPMTDLINNTPSRYFYYSLGINFGELDWNNTTKDIKDRVKIIAHRLRISPTKYNKELYELVANSGYGGDLVILFEDKISNLIYHNEDNIIEFISPVNICLMDRIQGSGHYVEINTKIICEFNRKNLHDDKGAPGYSYTHDVCGLIKGFMKNAVVRKTAKKTDKIIKTIINPEEQEANEREKRLDEKWRKTGECTFGDMKFSRHANASYRNEYPCGNKCVKCGTFWID